MEYQELKDGIRGHLNRAAEDFFMIGYFLRQVSEQALFLEDGYSSIWDFAKGEYGLSASSTSRFMAINARFSLDNGEHMAERYIGMGVSKLQEMLGLTDEELEKVIQETTVREIRAMKKKQEEPKSFFGLPKTEKEKHPYTYLPGCGDNKYACSDCARPCNIRQEERYCRTAPMGNPFSCTQMSEEKQHEMEYGIYGVKCQHLHQELAPVCERDKEPNPCCLTCEHKLCFSRCDVAKKKDEDERKNVQTELQKQQEEKRQQEVEEKNAAQKRKEDGWLLKFYKDIYPSTQQIIAQRDKAAITKELKTLYGNTYENGQGWICYPDKIVFRDNPEAEQLQITWGRFTTKLVDLLERFPETEKSILSGDNSRQTKPDIIEVDFCEVEDEQTESEPEVTLCDTCEQEGECYGKKTSDGDCIAYEERNRETELLEEEDEEPEPEAEADPEIYGRFEVELLLDKYRQDLKEYKKAEAPFNLIQRQRILVDALEGLWEKLNEGSQFETEQEVMIPGQMSLESLIEKSGSR